MAEPTNTVFPIAVPNKVNSPELLAWLEVFGPEKYLEASEIILIFKALKELDERTAGGGGGSGIPSIQQILEIEGFNISSVSIVFEDVENNMKVTVAPHHIEFKKGTDRLHLDVATMMFEKIIGQNIARQIIKSGQTTSGQQTFELPNKPGHSVLATMDDIPEIPEILQNDRPVKWIDDDSSEIVDNVYTFQAADRALTLIFSVTNNMLLTLPANLFLAGAELQVASISVELSIYFADNDAYGTYYIPPGSTAHIKCLNTNSWMVNYRVADPYPPQLQSLFLGLFPSLAALQAFYPVAGTGSYAQVDPGSGSNVKNYLWDNQDGWVLGSEGSGATNTDNLPEGNANLYFTAARVRDALLTGLSLVSSSAVAAADNILVAIGKLQAQTTLNSVQVLLREKYFHYRKTPTAVLTGVTGYNILEIISIPAGTLAVGSIVSIAAPVVRTAAGIAVATELFYHNTTPTLLSANWLGQVTIAANRMSVPASRDFQLTSAGLEVVGTTDIDNRRESVSANTVIPFDPAILNYIIVAIHCNNGSDGFKSPYSFIKGIK